MPGHFLLTKGVEYAMLNAEVNDISATTSINAVFYPKTGKVILSYAHFDGGPEHRGPILAKYYANEEKARRLITMGPASSIGPYIDPQEAGYSGEEAQSHSFRSPLKDVSVFYKRDRGEDNSEHTVLGDMTPKWLFIFLKHEYRWIPLLWLGIVTKSGKVIWTYTRFRGSNPVWHRVDAP